MMTMQPPARAAAELVRAIADDPDDPAPQLVIADWLLVQGDARGELIVLDHRERAGLLTDPDGIERLLLLAAEYTFPCAREPDESTLPFEGGGGYPVQYDVDHAGHHYYVRYRHGDLSVTIDDGDIDSGVDYPDGFPDSLGCALDGDWTDEETASTLAVLSDAIRAGTPFRGLRFPTMRNRLPEYDGGSRRVYRLPSSFTRPRGIARDRYGLAARDYHRWHALWSRLRSL